jgi:hypothetical protein
MAVSWLSIAHQDEHARSRHVARSYRDRGAKHTATAGAALPTPAFTSVPKLRFVLGVFTLALGGAFTLLWTGFLLWIFFSATLLLFS